jgi:GNAT superfamily N-acetyltransferase
LDAVAVLWRALLADHAAAGVETASGATPRSALDRLVGAADCAAWIVEHDGDATGFCAALVETAPAALLEPRRAAITELFVRPDRRRRGAGRALVAAALDWARQRGAARVEVRVAARNAEGQAFWRAQGFGDFVDVLDRRL